MDIILLCFVVFYFLRGFFKGFLSMIFALFGTFFVVLISWQLCGLLAPVLQNFVGDGIEKFLVQIFDSTFTGEFSNMESLEQAILGSRFGVLFSVLLKMLLSNITFQGTLTAGQILAPSLCVLLLKIVSFVIIFIFLFATLKFLKFFLNKFIKKCGFSVGNRICGGLLGILKGLLMFFVIYVSLSAFANFTFNETLLNFVTSGTISNWIYQNFILQIISIFY